MKEKIKLGTRGSSLALAQANQVIAALHKRFPDVEIETVVLRTQGDKILDRPLLDFGGKGAFITEFEEAISEGRIDLAVHSAKDMPAELGDGLVIAGALPRADARDVLVTRKGVDGLRIVGTGSLRRQCQLSSLCPGVICKGIRGNVPTRLMKLRSGEYDGLVLAAAGLKRLGLLHEEDLEYRFFSLDEMVPAGGQGIIAVEGRKGDGTTDMIAEISDSRAYAELALERNVLEIFNAGCHEAVGVISECRRDSVCIRIVREVDGQVLKLNRSVGAMEGRRLAEEMAHSMTGFTRGDFNG